MRDNEQHIDDLFRDMLNNYKEQPRPETWDGVKARLADKDNRKPKPFPLRWWWILSGLLIVAVLLLLSRGMLYTNDLNKPEGVVTPKANIQDPIMSGNEHVDITNGGIKTNPQKQNEAGNTDTRTSVGDIHQSEISASTEESNELVQKANTNIRNAIHADDNTEENEQLNFTAGTAKKIIIPKQEPAQRIEQNSSQNNHASEQRSREQPLSILKGRQIFPVTTVGTNAGAAKELTEVLNQGIGIARLSEDIRRDDNIDNAELITKGGTVQPPETIGETAPNQANTQKNKVQRTDERIPPGNTGKTSTKVPADTKNVDNEKLPDLRNFKQGFFSNISAGAKIGYQSSFNSNNNATKYVFTTFLQYNFSDKISVAIQPAYLSGKAKVTIDSNGRSYYNIIGSSLDSTVFRKMSNNIRDPDTIYRTYFYTESYDSVYVNASLQDKKLWDIEIPVVMRYKLFSWAYLQAGVVGSYSKSISTTETRRDFKGLQNTYTEELEPQLHELNQPLPKAPPPKSTKDLFSYEGDPIGSYEPTPTNNIKSLFRWGYTAGIGVEIKKRLLLDAGMIHMPATSPSIIDKPIQLLYTRPYYRFTIGYKFKK